MLDYPRPQFDEKDEQMRLKRVAEWDQIKEPRVGDFIEMLDGTTRRFTHDWGDGLQTTLGNSVDVSFYFYGDCMSFSGSLDRIIPLQNIQKTETIKDGRAWFFHHNHARASNGVYFSVPCRVYRQTETVQP